MNFENRFNNLLNEFGFNPNIIYQWYLWELNIFKAWAAYGYGDETISVAVIDNDFELNHPFICNKINQTKDFKDLLDVDMYNVVVFEGKYYYQNSDGSFGEEIKPIPFKLWINSPHGTAVASVLAGEMTQMIGVAPNIKLNIIRPDISVNQDQGWINAFQTAVEMGSDVVCCSMGYYDNNRDLSYEVYDALSILGRQAIFCFASGNAEYNDIMKIYHNIHALGFADHPSVISVGAMTKFGKIADYSRRNYNTFIAAPSESDGLGIIAADLSGEKGKSPTEIRYNFGGTSAACPMTAGVIALMLSQNPSLSVSEVKDIFRASCPMIDDQHHQLDAFACVKLAKEREMLYV